MIEVKAPNPYRHIDESTPRVFLGGSIEMGKAENWQERLTRDLSDTDAMILNPRRDDWDSSWIQDPTEGTQFHEQVTWEMDAQENSDVLVYYFADETKSPITLLELGRYGNTFTTVVRCTPNFWRYGNVKILCDRMNIPCVETYDELHKLVIERISW